MIVCLIPARAGSKRIKNKNIVKINNKPMIYWTIKNAKKSKIFDAVNVSTDSKKISNISIKSGAEIPFIRPKKYSSDKSSDEDVINHYLDYAKKKNIPIKTLCYLYPTSILLDYKIIRKSYKKFIKENNRNLLSISSYSAPIEIAMEIKGKSLIKYLNINNAKKRTQEMKKYYHDAGQFYWYLVKDYKIFKDKTFNYFYLDRKISIDVDTKEDLELLKVLYRNKDRT